MKRLSLAASSLLLCGISLNAQSLEEAIKGVDVGGYLKYEYEDNRYGQKNFRKEDSNTDPEAVQHTWSSEATLKTPVINNVAVTLGVKYEQSNNVNHGKGVGDNDGDKKDDNPFASSGLGSGGDDPFRVTQFYATITPDSTNTSVYAGKMFLNTPLNDSGADRGTGIVVTNNDIANTFLTFGIYDSWALDDDPLGTGEGIAKPMFMLGANLGHETSYGNFNADLWGFHADDTIDYGLYGLFAWGNAMFSASAQYVFTQVDDDPKGVIGLPQGANNKNDFLSLQAGVDLGEMGVPVTLDVGYITSFQKNFGVSLDDEGALQKVGAIWFDTNGTESTRVNFSALTSTKNPQKKDLDVFYASATYSPLENLTLGLDFVSGKNKLSQKVNKEEVANKYKFYEITPNVTYAYNDKIEISTYYAYLRTERSGADWEKNKSDKLESEKEQRSQFKVEATYSF